MIPSPKYNTGDKVIQFRPGTKYMDFKNGEPFNDYVPIEEIVIEIDKNSTLVSEITPTLKEEYAEFYLAWINGEDASAGGLPLQDIPLDYDVQLKLNKIGVYTAEQAIYANEITKLKMGIGASDIIERAKKALKQREALLKGENNKVVEEQETEMKKQLDALRQQIAEMQAAKDKQTEQIKSDDKKK